MSGVEARTPNEMQAHVDLKVVDRVRALCIALPGAFEKEAWGDPTFRVNKRVFAGIKFGHQQTNLWLAAPEGAQETLLAADPARFYYPPYEGSRGCIGVRLDTPPGVDWEEVAFLIAQAHETIRTKSAPGRTRSRA